MSVSSRATGQPCDRFDHRAHRTFTIGAGDVNDFPTESPRDRDSQFSEQMPNGIEAQLDPEQLGAVEPVDGFVVIHRIT